MTGPGVVVVHDWYGVLPHVADVADELRMAGFRVEVVDVYGGTTTRDPGRAEELARALDRGRACASIMAAALRLRGATGRAGVGALGFSLGGSLVLQVAREGAFDALVSYYATLDDGVADISCPVQLHLAESDEFEPDATVEAFVAALSAAGTPVDTFAYPGTAHSFANADVALGDRAAAEVALARSVGFLHARLGG